MSPVETGCWGKAEQIQGEKMDFLMQRDNFLIYLHSSASCFSERGKKKKKKDFKGFKIKIQMCVFIFHFVAMSIKM